VRSSPPSPRFRPLWFACLLPLLASAVPAEPVLQPRELAGKRLVVLGDSITQQGTWVSFLEYYLLREFPALDFDLISVGLASETASGLSEEDHPFPRPCIHERLEAVLAATKPDILLACYGMNDGIYHPPSPEREAAYRAGILKLVAKAREAGVGTVVLLTPGTFEGSEKKTVREPPYGYKRPYRDYDGVLAGYAAWIMSLAQPGVCSIDLHTPMAEFAARKRVDDPAFVLARDGIHPGPLGHLIMTEAILRSLGMPVPDDAEAELKRVLDDPLYKLAASHRQLRSDGWLPYIGYTRGRPFKTDSITETESKASDLMAQINALRRQR
jgi:lysophospholipase L1-like esterase